MFDDENSARFALRLLGTLIGVLASMIMVAPEHTKAALSRAFVSLSMGFVFGPTVPLWGAFGLHPFGFLTGQDSEMIIARAAACGFCIWFILEFAARMLSSTEWMVKLAQSIIAADAQRKSGDTGDK